MHLADEVADSGAGRNVEALGGLGWASISRRRRSIHIHASRSRTKNGGCRFIPTSKKNKHMTTTGIFIEKEIARQGNTIWIVTWRARQQAQRNYEQIGLSSTGLMGYRRDFLRVFRVFGQLIGVDIRKARIGPPPAYFIFGRHNTIQQYLLEITLQLYPTISISPATNTYLPSIPSFSSLHFPNSLHSTSPKFSSPHFPTTLTSFPKNSHLLLAPCSWGRAVHYLYTLVSIEQLSKKCKSSPVFFFKLIMRSLHHPNILWASLMATHIPLNIRHVPDILQTQIYYP